MEAIYLTLAIVLFSLFTSLIISKLYNCWLFTGFLWFLFIAFTLCTKFVDLGAIGPESSTVGFSHMNRHAQISFGQHEIWDKISDIPLLISLLMALFFGILGLIEFIKRKSLKKVDVNILSTGILYLAIIAFYVFFEFINVNYRPVLIEGKLEASYPSSHILIVSTITWNALVNLSYYSQKKCIYVPCALLGGILIGITFAGRMFSGMHWLSDALAGIILSLALVSTCKTITRKIITKKAN
ncbi:MAG: phosphatase PAP2 family protein [Treponemataceae bacterium]|nr:phosphatase PAP2 family protein [Treponemataceae bacterium]